MRRAVVETYGHLGLPIRTPEAYIAEARRTADNTREVPVQNRAYARMTALRIGPSGMKQSKDSD